MTKCRYHRRDAEEMIAKLMPDGPPLAMYDLGIGPYAEFETLKAIWPGMALFGCEPDPYEYGQVKGMFCRLGGVIADVAVGLETGRRDFNVCKPGLGGGSLHWIGGNRQETISVETWSLDLFDRWAGQPDRILLWADIEGAELEALQGGKELLGSGRVWWLNVETRHVAKEGLPCCTKDVTDLLDSYGYAAVHRYNVHGSYPEAAGDMVYFRKGVQPLIPASCGQPLNLEAWKERQA